MAFLICKVNVEKCGEHFSFVLVGFSMKEQTYTVIDEY